MGQGEHVLDAQEVMTVSFGEGQVDPAIREARGEIDPERCAELTARIQSGEFTLHTNPDAIPCHCMDCRRQTDGQMVVGPKAAGGTTTLVIADALTYNNYRHPGEKAPEHKRRIFTELKKANHHIGGHIADNVTKEGYAGCGAEDKLDSADPADPSILEFIVRQHAVIFDTLRQLGYEVDNELQEMIVRNAAQLRQEGYATTGAELSEVGKEVVGEENIRVLTGSQNGVLADVETEPGAVLDTERLAAEYGDDYQVFEVSAWSIANGAEAISLTPKEAHDKTIAGLVYNLAAAGVIAGNSMRFVVNKR